MTELDWEGRSFGEIAHQLHAMGDAPSTLEGHWNRAALDTIVGGRLVDPPVAVLEQLTGPGRAWDMPPWPPERRGERALALVDCHFLALALRHRAWLQDLRSAWDHPQGYPDLQDLCQGQIDIGLHGKAAAWDEDLLELMRADGLMDERSSRAPADGDMGAGTVYHPRISEADRHETPARPSRCARASRGWRPRAPPGERHASCQIALLWALTTTLPQGGAPCRCR
jgi:hypothetical protein